MVSESKNEQQKRIKHTFSLLSCATTQKEIRPCRSSWSESNFLFLRAAMCAFSRALQHVFPVVVVSFFKLTLPEIICSWLMPKTELFLLLIPPETDFVSYCLMPQMKLNFQLLSDARKRTFHSARNRMFSFDGRHCKLFFAPLPRVT